MKRKLKEITYHAYLRLKERHSLSRVGRKLCYGWIVVRISSFRVEYFFFDSVGLVHASLSTPLRGRYPERVLDAVGVPDLGTLDPAQKEATWKVYFRRASYVYK